MDRAHRPTLDDVFLTLTGHVADPGAPAGDAERDADTALGARAEVPA